MLAKHVNHLQISEAIYSSHVEANNAEDESKSSEHVTEGDDKHRHRDHCRSHQQDIVSITSENEVIGL